MNTTRPTVAEINLRNIVHNLKLVKEKVGKSVRMMAVVKANAYGHGLVAVAQHIESRVDYFGIATAEEGAALREAGIRKPILVFTLPNEAQARIIAAGDMEATVCSVREAEFLQRAAQRVRKNIGVHLKIETGMNRLGVRPAEVGVFLQALRRFGRLELRGAYTHFASADNPHTEFTRLQLSRFEQGLDQLQRAGVSSILRHCANSAALIHLPESYYDMVRPGLMLYGYDPGHPSAPRLPLKRAMDLKTEVSFVKRIEAGESVSYGRRFVARRRTSIATLPIGYADGYTRLLSGKVHVLIHGRRFPVVGLICMDQLMVDVGTEDVRAGDEAILIGEQGGQVIDAWQLAEKIGTIPYEICCGISARVPRVYITS